MKRILTALFATMGVLVLILSYRTSLGPLDVATVTPANNAVATPPNSQKGHGNDVRDGGDPQSSSGDASASTPQQTRVPNNSSASDASANSPTSAGALSDGTFTGTSAATMYGDVEVRVKIAGGSITDVSVPVYPSTSSRDQRISARAIPQLVSATLQSQSANVHMVSGATYTSQGYQTSLQSAIDQARK